MWQQAWLARESRQGAAGLMSDQLRQQKAREQSELAERIEKVQREKSWLADDNTAFTSAGDQLMRQLEMEHLGDMLDEARDEPHGLRRQSCVGRRYRRRVGARRYLGRVRGRWAAGG